MNISKQIIDNKLNQLNNCLIDLVDLHCSKKCLELVNDYLDDLLSDLEGIVENENEEMSEAWFFERTFKRHCGR